MEVKCEIIGEVGGESVDSISIRNQNGMQITCITYGATMTSVLAPDLQGVIDEVVLCPTFHELISSANTKPKYVGTIGRVANRIANGTFHMENKSYNLAINNGPNHLHGGLIGFDKKIWRYEVLESEDSCGVRFSCMSEDMEEGYPGNVQITAEYSLNKNNEIRMHFTAVTDALTPINMTNHAFWNISGGFKRSARDHIVHLACEDYLPVDGTLIPTGLVMSVKDTPFDFTQPKLLGDGIDAAIHVGTNGVSDFVGIDHSFVVPNNPETTKNGLQYVGSVTDVPSGRQLLVYTNQPAVQMYTGNFLSKDPISFPFYIHNAMCIENQKFPDSVNKPNFPSTLLSPGDVYEHISLFTIRTSGNAL